jgi:hypothetical protein
MFRATVVVDRMPASDDIDNKTNIIRWPDGLGEPKLAPKFQFESIPAHAHRTVCAGQVSHSNSALVLTSPRAFPAATKVTMLSIHQELHF